MKKFNDAEEQTSRDWKPHALPSTCQQDLDQHKELASAIECLKEPVANIKSEAEGLQAQTNDKDVDSLTRLVDDLEDRYERLMIALEDKQVHTPTCTNTNYYNYYSTIATPHTHTHIHTHTHTHIHPHTCHPCQPYVSFCLLYYDGQGQLESAKDSADNFNQRLMVLTEKLNDLEEHGSKTSSIHSEAEEVKRQLEEHKVILLSQTVVSELFSLSCTVCCLQKLLSSLEQLEFEIEELESVGGGLMKQCVPEDGKAIKKQLNMLRYNNNYYNNNNNCSYYCYYYCWLFSTGLNTISFSLPLCLTSPIQKKLF